MPRDLKSLDALVNAACAIAFAREQEDDTNEEWDDLNYALLAALEDEPDDSHPRIGFKDGMLMRWSRLASGAPEDHACTQPDFEAIAEAIRDLVDDARKNGRDGWFTVDEIARCVNRSWMTAHVAITFLLEHELVRTNGTARRLEVSADFTPEAALAEFVVAEMQAGSAAR